MKLLKIRLVNIRTYVDETVDFDSGITLLSGDIGSGKSSILLGVEFALFGSSRSDLPAEALLRKGANNGLVDLSFEVHVNGVLQTVTVRRTLSLTKQGIRQGAGHLIVNGVKKDLTPVELKAEIVELLGYPTDLAGRGKNYVYRYTVYCPQEEMKYILQENREARLDILRKLFGIEKYKIVRDNLQIYLRDARKEKLVLETRLEPLPGFVEERLLNISEKEKLQLQLSSLEENKQIVQAQFLEINQKLDSLLELKTRKEKLVATLGVLSEREKGHSSRRNVVENSLREVDEELAGLLLDESMTVEGVAIEISRLEKELREFREKKVRLESEVARVQDTLKSVKEQLNANFFDAEAHGRFESRLNDIISLGLDQKKLEEQKLTLENKEKELVAQRSGLLVSIESLKSGLSSVLSLGSCPTCKQEVGNSHKEHLADLEKVKILDLEKQLEIIVSSEKNLSVKLENIRLDIEKSSALTREKEKLELDVKLSLERQKRSLELRRQLKENVVLNNSFMKDMSVVLEEEKVTVPRLESRLSMLRQVNSKLETRRQLRKHKKGLETERFEIASSLEKIHLEKQELQGHIDLLVVSEEEIMQIRLKKESVQKLFEEKSVLVAQCKVNLEHCVTKIKNLDLKISDLQEVKASLVVLSEQLHWLQSYFMNLTYTIEKEIMLKIYHRFNELFVHWFSMLVSGSEISARLDSSFTPVIEQNGHEISFAYLSGGERTAASLAYRLSLNKVINDVVHDIRTKDLLMLDEPSDGFSSEQLDRLRDVLENLNLGQIVIVSHEATVEGFVNRVVRVEKSGGKSSILS